MISDQSKYADLLVRARKRYKQAVDAEREIREEAHKDLLYLAGEQWPEKVKTERERGPSPRPCLVFNKVLPPVTQLGNQARQNKPALQVNPVDSAGDPDTAKVIAGMARHIEYDSDGDQAYDTALFYAAGCSFGYWTYDCEFSDPESFDQDVKIVTVDDPFSIYLDCFATKPDRSDMKWAFEIKRLPNDVHEAEYGKDKADLSSDFAKELSEDGWRDDDSKQVAKYWEVETKEKTLRIRKDPDGTVHSVYLEDLENGDEIPADPATGEPEFSWVLDDEGEPKERTVEIPQVMMYVINGAEVLETPTKWDGSTIPIVIVTGLEMVVRGKKKIFSMTRFARDPQQLLNFYKTMEAETISLAPKPKYVGAVGQFKTKRRDWQRANTDNAAYLEYDVVSVGDKMAPEPQWRTFDPPVQALAIGAAAAADDIKASTGYFDPSLGQVKGDSSGVAIGKLQKQGDVSNFHFMDNLARAMKRGGRILVDLIPKKYDTAREVRIIGEDQKQRIVMVNAPFIDDNGKAMHHKLDFGKFDVTVNQGPSYSTQRQETREMMMSLAQGDPDIMKMFGDIFFENNDFIGADRMAKRAKKMLPPQLQDDDDHKEIPPAVQSKMQQDAAQIQQLTQQNQQLLQMAKGKMAELQTRAESAEKVAILNAESRERVANENNRAKILAAETLAKNATMNALAEQDHQRLTQEMEVRAGLLHDQISVESDAAGAAMQHQQDQQSQQADQAHEAQQAELQRQHEQGMQGAEANQETAVQGADQEHEQGLQESAQEAAAKQAQQAQEAAKAAAKVKPPSAQRKPKP